MRYYLTREGVSYAWLVELEDTRQTHFDILYDGKIPADWATMPLPESTGAAKIHRAGYLDHPRVRIRPLPLTDPPLVSPLDFLDPRKED